MKPLTMAESNRITESERWRMIDVMNGKTVVTDMHKGVDAVLITWAKRNHIFVRIDRKSSLGNPFKVGKDGTRTEVIEAFEQHIWNKVEDPVNGCCGGSPQPIVEAILAIKQPSVLGCWCHPLPCHGDVIARILNEQQLTFTPAHTSRVGHQLNLF